jgi:phage shock protein A
MIAAKFWRTLRAQLNKLANALWAADPVAQMQYEYDRIVEQLKEGRAGLEQYRALVERVGRQVTTNRGHVADLEAKIKAYLQAGDRETAARFALELQKTKKDLAENEAQLALHEQAYQDNLAKLKQANSRLGEVREKIQRYNADLKMSRAEAEVARLAESFNLDPTTDFGRIEQVVQDRISLNRAQARVAGDLAGHGTIDLKREQAAERVLADQALREFEAQAGLVTPETGRIPEASKELGPARDTTRQT